MNVLLWKLREFTNDAHIRRNVNRNLFLAMSPKYRISSTAAAGVCRQFEGYSARRLRRMYIGSLQIEGNNRS
jgi:hypothetical protein